MVAIKEVRSANNALNQDSLTAVFTGATNGIGLATLRAFAKHAKNPTAIIVGRSQSKFAPELESLKQLNPTGHFTFLETEISLLKNIDAVSAQIQQQLAGRKIDVLFMSQGYLPFFGRENNAEGLDTSTSLRYYGRIRFIQNLLPSLAERARVVSVLAGGQEGKIFEDDLDLERNFSLVNEANQFTTMMTLAFDKFAEQNPQRSFMHVYPGLVDTGMVGRTMTGLLGLFVRWFLEPLVSLFALKPEDVGERMLYYGTSAPAYGRGCWSLDGNGEPTEVQTLKEYRAKGWAEKVTEHNARIFERVLSQ